MDPYLVLVFLHVAAAGGLFAAFGVEVVALRRLQGAASARDARMWLPGLLRPAGGIGHISMLVLLATGIWMMAARWGPNAWMTVALTAIAAMIAVAATAGRASLRRLAAALEPEAATDAWPQAARSAALGIALWLRTGLLVGIIGLMTLKPGAVGSLAIVVAGAVLGVAVAAFARRNHAELRDLPGASTDPAPGGVHADR